MNKYTIFYRCSFCIGSHTSSLFYYQLVEAPSDLDGSLLLKYICNKYKIDNLSVEYFIHGWVEMVNEGEDKSDITQIMPSRETLEAIAERNPIPQSVLDERDIP